MRGRLAGVALLCSGMFVVAGASAQTSASEPVPGAPAKRLQWDVISVKPMLADSCPGNRGGVGYLPDGMTATCVPVAFVVENAYRIMDGSRIIGLPEWAKDSSHAYAIEARVGAEDVAAYSKLSRDDKFRMLQQVLAERFQMKAHMEKRPRPAYDLVVTKHGSKLKASASNRLGFSQFDSIDGRVWWVNAPLTNLPSLLGRETGRPVVDKTGLTGKYSFRLEYEPAVRAIAETSDRPSVFTALEEQLGLKLVPAKESVDVVVIDSIEQPGAN